MMKRLLISTCCILYTCLAVAGSSYQIDLILFTHLQSGDKNDMSAMGSSLIPISKNAIPLLNDTTKSFKPYHLLSATQSELRNEYYSLNHKPAWKVLGSYSWRQPGASQTRVALPLINHNGWQVQGTLRVRQSNYYLLDTDLQLSSPDKPESFINVMQKQRLKGELVYYLDHPQLGMLIKIHKVT